MTTIESPTCATAEPEIAAPENERRRYGNPYPEERAEELALGQACAEGFALRMPGKEANAKTPEDITAKAEGEELRAAARAAFAEAIRKKSGRIVAEIAARS